MSIRRFEMIFDLPEENRLLFSFSASAGLIGALLSILRFDGVWFITSIIYVFFIYGISTIKGEDQIQRDLYKWSVVPIFFGVTGLSGILRNNWMFGDLAFAVLMTMLAFMSILILTYHTDFRTNFYFSVSFIFLFTVAAGAVLGIGQFLSDYYLETMILEDNEQLMLELFFMTFVGFVGSYSFKTYRELYYLKWESYSILNQVRSTLTFNSENPREDFLRMLYTYFGEKENDKLILLSKFFQLGIVFLIVYSLFTQNMRVVGLAIPSFIASMIPYLYSQNLEKKVPSYFKFWISLSLIIYVSGETAAFQRRFDWWNNFTHFLAGLILGILILLFLIYLNQVSDNLYIPDWLISFFVLIFILSISVFWEQFEFFMDTFFYTSLQGGVEDTAFDMLANTVGASLSMVLTNHFTPFKVLQPLRKKIRRSFRSML